MPNIYQIAANQSFLDCLISGIFAKFGKNNLDDLIILLPSRRAVRNLTNLFYQYFQGKPHFLPQIISLGDFAEENITLSAIAQNLTIELPKPALHDIEQHIILAKLIIKYQNYSIAQALALAQELVELLNDLAKEDISLQKLKNLAIGDYAIHQQQMLKLLANLSQDLPAELEQLGKLSQITHRNKLVNLQSQLWQHHPPGQKIIAAGSCGTISSTTNLLKTIASLPQGMVIIPAIDQDLDDKGWDLVDEFHPQFNIKELLRNLKTERKKVSLWYEGHYFSKRSQIISQSLRPADSCEQWLTIPPISPDEIANMHYVLADNLQHEANIICAIIHQTLQQDKKYVALVTNNRNLAARVISLLTKFDVLVNDSAGTRLLDSSLMVFFRLIAQMVQNDFSPLHLLGTLKHPLCRMPKDLVYDLELNVLRGVVINTGLQAISKSLASKLELKLYFEELLPPQHQFMQLMQQKSNDFVSLLRAHIVLLEHLGHQDLWQSEIGMAVSEFLENLLVHAKLLPEISTLDYLYILETFASSILYRPQEKQHPRVDILSTIEARFYHHDVVILADLNEGSMPANIGNGLWLNNIMRANIGLYASSRKIGQMTHDFYALACAKELYLTRSSKIDGASTIPSRLLLRLVTLLRRFDLNIENHTWGKLAKLIHLPQSINSCPAPRPTPALSLRPTTLSVTEIEKLLRDPYWIYAKKILRLRKLLPLESQFSAADFGNFVHKALEHFTQYHTSSNNWYELLLDSARYVLGDLLKQSVIRALWWPRFERIAGWISQENIFSKQLKYYAEVRGKMYFDIAGLPFYLQAKADCLIIGQGISIIDYKTGALPNIKDIKQGVASQMVLEALIAANGGFMIQDKINNVEKIIYLRLTGGEIAAEEFIIEDGLNELMNQAFIGVSKLIRAFYDERTPYYASPLPELSLQYNDYAHLARNKEWVM